MKKILNSLQYIQSKQDLNLLADQLILRLRTHQQMILDQDWSVIGKMVSLMTAYYDGVFPDPSKKDTLCRFIAELLYRQRGQKTGTLSLLPILDEFPLDVLDALNEIAPSKQTELILLARQMADESAANMEKLEKLTVQMATQNEAEIEFMEIISESNLLEIIDRTDQFCRSYFEEHEADILKKTRQTMEENNQRIEQMEKELKRILPERRLEPQRVQEWIDQLGGTEISGVPSERLLAKTVKLGKQVKVQSKQSLKTKATSAKPRMVTQKQSEKMIPPNQTVETPDAKNVDQHYSPDKVIQEIKDKARPKGQAI